MMKKISTGNRNTYYEYTAPNGDVWTIKNLGYGRGFGGVRWVANLIHGVGTKGGTGHLLPRSPYSTPFVRETRTDCVDVIDRYSIKEEE